MMRFSLICSSVLVVSVLLIWSLMNLVGFLGVLLIEFLIVTAFLVVLVWSIVRALRYRNREAPMVAVPIYINMVSLLLALGLQSSDIPVRLDFYLKLHQREGVVTRIMSGELKPNVSYNPTIISLSGIDRLLADDGDVVLRRQGHVTAILFFMYRNLGPNRYSGFLYRSDNKGPTNSDAEGTITRIDQLQPHWFWIDVT